MEAGPRVGSVTYSPTAEDLTVLRNHSQLSCYGEHEGISPVESSLGLPSIRLSQGSKSQLEPGACHGGTSGAFTKAITSASFQQQDGPGEFIVVFECHARVPKNQLVL